MMKKNIGLIVFGVFAVVLFLGFMSIQAKKKSAEERQGTGLIFPEMMNQLSQNMSLWSRMNQDEKKQAVNAVITIYKNRDNIAILNTTDFYVGKIDETLANEPPVLNLDVMTVIKILAVMEYDFYNGKNKDAVAREILGQKAFEENQKRRAKEA